MFSIDLFGGGRCGVIGQVPVSFQETPPIHSKNSMPLFQHVTLHAKNQVLPALTQNCFFFLIVK